MQSRRGWWTFPPIRRKPRRARGTQKGRKHLFRELWLATKDSLWERKEKGVFPVKNLGQRQNRTRLLRFFKMVFYLTRVTYHVVSYSILKFSSNVATLGICSQLRHFHDILSTQSLTCAFSIHSLFVQSHWFRACCSPHIEALMPNEVFAQRNPSLLGGGKWTQGVWADRTNAMLDLELLLALTGKGAPSLIWVARQMAESGIYRFQRNSERLSSHWERKISLRFRPVQSTEVWQGVSRLLGL